MPQADADLPAWLSRAEQLSRNRWWTWHSDVPDLFREIDVDAWVAANHNPITMLRRLEASTIRERIRRLGIEDRLDFQYHRLQQYLVADDTWCSRHGGIVQVAPVAYFSAEFGVHESLPLYSGGLGVLAADCLKSASDLGVPMIGVGLFYAAGYFHQRLDAGGWQHEEYGLTDLNELPLVRAAANDGSALTVEIPCGSEVIRADVWLAHVGRVRLLLLDTDVDPNSRAVRDLTAQLYGGDSTTRIRQEMVLGIGGMRAFDALGIRPSVLHLNEGHSAFAVLECTRARMARDEVSFADAFRETTIQTAFTTHTPVAAGHDRFPVDLVETHLGWLRGAMGLNPHEFMRLGRINANDDGEPFCMTVLALKGSRYRNGVSSLHAHVARRMWQSLWPNRPEEAVPIGHVTNGVHTLSWLAPPMKRIYDVALGADWPDAQTKPDTWRGIYGVPNRELWDTRAVLRGLLVDFVEARTGTLLRRDSLTIGFAKRFTGYKRATLLLTDRNRLARVCGDSARPVQFVFAGKAHPRDDEGKRMLQEIVELSRDPRFEGRIAVIEDYDINVARHLVHGVDAWLNTPLRPLEASGTSGQKVLLNGGLNISVLDGWWAEAYNGRNGFAIGATAVHRDGGVQWQRDATALYDTLEREVLPTFFEGLDGGVPVHWVDRIKTSIASLAWRFNADRMVMDYVAGAYLPAAGGLSLDMGQRR
jgi:starch phosphorylase